MHPRRPPSPHSREDYPERDDEKYLAHTLVWRGAGEAPATKIDYKPVTITKFEPKPRVY
jgi:succinate dehydrogenase / fumarate reductase flavoprotein subunit